MPFYQTRKRKSWLTHIFAARPAAFKHSFRYLSREVEIVGLPTSPAVGSEQVLRRSRVWVYRYTNLSLGTIVCSYQFNTICTFRFSNSGCKGLDHVGSEAPKLERRAEVVQCIVVCNKEYRLQEYISERIAWADDIISISYSMILSWIP
ncbi:hypothetical protein TWF225_006638 [Orbilia oligospora]|nr:hypothetical protein TWF225_006638 [Orbilia oligospora]